MLLNPSGLLCTERLVTISACIFLLISENVRLHYTFTVLNTPGFWQVTSVWRAAGHKIHASFAAIKDIPLFPFNSTKIMKFA